jgi:lauroyl/myristoyl acyltransferase
MGAIRDLRKKIKYRSIYFLVKYLVLLSHWVPRKSWLSFCGSLGKLMGLLLKRYRQMASVHLTMAFGKEK